MNITHNHPILQPFLFENYNPISFSPVSHLVDLLTDEIDSDTGKSLSQVLNYFARPIDYLIQTFIATPIFETYKHFHGIIKCAKTNRVGEAILRAVASPITYPARIIFKVFIVGVNRLVVGFFDLFIIYKVIFDILHPQSRAEARMKTRHEEHPYFFSTQPKFIFSAKSYAFSYQAGGKNLPPSVKEKRFIDQMILM